MQHCSSSVLITESGTCALFTILESCLGLKKMCLCLFKHGHYFSTAAKLGGFKQNTPVLYCADSVVTCGYPGTKSMWCIQRPTDCWWLHTCWVPLKGWEMSFFSFLQLHHFSGFPWVQLLYHSTVGVSRWADKEQWEVVNIRKVPLSIEVSFCHGNLFLFFVFLSPFTRKSKALTCGISPFYSPYIKLILPFHNATSKMRMCHLKRV